MFHVSKSSASLTDRVGSIVALTLLIATWCVVYAAINPPDPVPARHVVIAQVRP